MNKIAIITDTDSSLPVELAERYAIQQVPITVHFGNENYATGVDIDDRLLFEKVDKLNKLPTTSAPSPGAFASAYERALTAGSWLKEQTCATSR